MAGINQKTIVLLAVLFVAGLFLLGGLAPQALPTAPNQISRATAGGQVQLVVEGPPRNIGTGAVTLQISPAS